jgi:phage gp29-like protein
MVEKPGILRRLFGSGKLSDDSATQDDSSNRTMIIHRDPIGSTGSQNFSGYTYEEYLIDLRGKRAADIYDKMRRGDTQASMILSAVKNPIKSAKWSIEPADDSEEAKQDADLIEHILFNDLDQTWSEFLTEALTFVDFGFSLFEPTHKVVFNHKRFGTFNGIRSFGFRSQRTIERWNLDKETGKLASVAQYAYGDLQRLVDLPAEFLLVFTLQKEGSNYEGISGLRPCYGPWLRKNNYLKLNAIGIEKSAVPTAIAKVPEGKGDSPELERLKEVLGSWVSHEQGYITVPAGWDISLNSNNFDPSKVEASVDAEDKRMVKAFLANFLELGMSGTGAYALSNDLSDFFLGGLEHVAGIVTGAINANVIPNLIKMNRGPREAYPKLKVSGISDKAGQELAKSLKDLSDSKVLIPDDMLEDDVRRRYGLPKKSDIGQRFGGQTDGGTPADPAPAEASAGFKNSERIQLAEQNARKQIGEGKARIKEVMQTGLSAIAQDLVKQIMGKVKRLPPSQQLDAVKNLNLSGVGDYKRALIDTLAAVAAAALAQARKEVPKKKNVTLAGTNPSLKLSEFDNLPPDVKKKIQTQADLLVDSQTADLEKAAYFQFTHSVDSTDSDALIEKDLLGSTGDYLSGPSVEAGSGNVTALVVNSARSAFFFDDDVLEEIESFTFVNGDPVSPICQDLAGTTFAKDDPEAERYFPPLHHNCKSYLVPNLVGGSKREIESLKPSSPALEKYVTLSDCGHFSH